MTNAVSLWLNSYDDLFSDFDHRNYDVRAISDDFLVEAKKFTSIKSGKLQLRFHLPIIKRKKEVELLIRKRLQNHFKRHYLLLNDEKKEKVKRGILLTVLGLTLMVGASALSIYTTNFWGKILIIIFEPGGWFLTWMGLDQVFFEGHKEDYTFYDKMNKCEIEFHTY